MTEQVYRSKQVEQKQKQQKQIKVPNIEIYYWAPCIKNLRVGHLALRIIDDEDDIYISHWPKGQKVSFSSDIVDEGGGPDEYLLIPHNMIYVGEIKKWWTKFLKDAREGTEKYNILLNNCAQVVYRALRAGSFPHFVVWYTPKISPYEVKEWVKGYKGVEFKKDRP